MQKPHNGHGEMPLVRVSPQAYLLRIRCDYRPTRIKGAHLMAIIETSRPVPFGAVSTLRIVNVFEAALGRALGAYRAYKTEKALRALSNAQLEDIGLERAQIHAVALRAVQL
jgi:uncharacterized protein YjiS (DUF1127 family)